MEILLEKDDFLNGIKMVEKITAQKSVQPILSNILIQTLSSDRVVFMATDLSLTISNKIKAVRGELPYGFNITFGFSIV